MTKPVLLNNVDHHALRVITQRGSRYGDSVMYAMTFPAEFRDLLAKMDPARGTEQLLRDALKELRAPTAGVL